MKELALGLTILILLFSMVYSAEPIFPYKYNVETLENGLKVITIPMESNGIVAYYSVTRTGSRDEWEPGHSGFAHLFEHMMFRGTEKYPGSMYGKIMTEMGADANAYTTDDYTCYHLNFSAEDLEKVIEMESDRFINLKYSEEAFKTETGAIYGEYLKGRTSPWEVLSEELYNKAFDKHTYKHTTIGFEKDIKAMPTMYNYSKSFFNRYYRPENVVILVVGAIEHNQVINLIQKYYGDWKAGYVPPKITPEPEQKKERTVSVKYPGKTLPILTVAYKGDALDPANKNYVAALLLNELALGQTSDLYKRLVIQEQKVQYLFTNFGMNRDPRLFEIYSLAKSESEIENVREEIYKTLEKFKNEPVDEKKLQDIKSNFKYSFLMGLDTPDNVAGNLANFIAVTGGIEVIEALFSQFDAITPADIQQTAKYYFTPERRTVAILKGAKS